MSKELLSLKLRGRVEKGIALVRDGEISYGYAMNVEDESRTISVSIQQYNQRDFPRMPDGKYILRVDGMVVGLIVYREGRPDLSRMPRYLSRLEWLEDRADVRRDP